jgi:hypothetical protein
VKRRFSARRSAERVFREAETPLEAAQDLMWALINSPAFLFNH